MNADERVVVTMATAESVAVALADAVAGHFETGFPRFPTPVVVADASTNRDRPDEDDFGRLIVRLVGTHTPDARLIVPESPIRALLGRVTRRRNAVSPVDVSGRAERLSTVWIPTSIVNARTVIAVNDVRRETADRPVLAIGTWARFAGWRERVGARVAKPEQGLAAEIALAVRPALILLAGLWRGRTVVVATSDQIAAELVGLALTRARRAAGDDEIGPWQDELVQRATELDLGVRLPDQIALRLVLSGTTAGSDARMLLEEVAIMLGVADFAVKPV